MKKTKLIDVEAIRAWLKQHRKYRKVSDATGYPYDSLCKFAGGSVAEPRLRNLGPLMTFMEKAQKKAKKA